MENGRSLDPDSARFQRLAGTARILFIYKDMPFRSRLGVRNNVHEIKENNMAIREIVRLGNPSLRERSTELHQHEFNSPWLMELIKDLWNSMEHYGGVGIAAPQIGVNRRVCVFGFEKSARYPQAEPVPYTILCNPEIVILDNEPVGFHEGCLSVDDLRGLVMRPRKIIYRGVDQFGTMIERTVSDFHARLVLHEIDHLDGTVFVDRVNDTHTLGFRDELIKYILT